MVLFVLFVGKTLQTKASSEPIFIIFVFQTYTSVQGAWVKSLPVRKARQGNESVQRDFSGDMPHKPAFGDRWAAEAEGGNSKKKEALCEPPWVNRLICC